MGEKEKNRIRHRFPVRLYLFPGTPETDTDAAERRYKIFYRTECDFTSEESTTFRRGMYNLIIRSSGQILIDLFVFLKTHNLLKK